MLLENVKIFIKSLILIIVFSGCKVLETHELKKEMLVKEKKRKYLVYLPKKVEKLKRAKTLFFGMDLLSQEKNLFNFYKS